MTTSVGKRQREQQKLEKARAKAQRRADRQSSASEPGEVPAARSESELIEDLRALHQSVEAGEISPEQFEERREHLQAQFGQL